MPTILRIGPYRFHFYSRENLEQPHIHVERDDLEAKFWLSPVTLASNYGFRVNELNKIGSHVRDNRNTLIKDWNDFHG